MAGNHDTDHHPSIGEAERIYQAIFQRPAPPVLRERFAELSERLDREADSRERERCARAFETIHDLQALELACRYTGDLSLLCAKFRLVVFLAETLPENQDLFVAERPDLPAALWGLLAGGLETLYRLAKGLYLLRVRLGSAG